MSRHSQYSERCRHFNGIQHERCDAGQRYVDVRDSKSPGPYRWPCLTLIGKPRSMTVCELRVLMTPEEHDAEERELFEAATRALAAIAAGKCHVCGEPGEPSKLVGRCRYNACGHRRGQETQQEDTE